MLKQTAAKDGTVHRKLAISLFVCMIAAGLNGSAVRAQEKGDKPPANVQTPVLEHAVMCEQIKDYVPVHSAVVFSIAAGKVSCYTRFDPVPEKTHIFHHWYHSDKTSTKKRLVLKPPSWATFSTIQLRQTDKGPWRVEIIDHQNRTLKILRFSVLD